MKQINVFEDLLIVAGISISLADLQSILGIIILSFQCILIFIKVFMKIKDAVKKGNTEEIEKIVDETKKELDDINPKKK